MSSDLINEFLDKKSLKALEDLISADDISKVKESSVLVSQSFNPTDDSFKPIADSKDSAEDKLISSFNNNLVLLIQKTWVEKSDIALKDQLLYQLDVFLGNDSWKDNYILFLQLINQAVFLMFGQKPDTPDFAEYTLRIDPEFGIFWWYISNLPPKTEWSEEKCRLAMMLGMYFLANY